MGASSSRMYTVLAGDINPPCKCTKSTFILYVYCHSICHEQAWRRGGGRLIAYGPRGEADVVRLSRLRDSLQPAAQPLLSPGRIDRRRSPLSPARPGHHVAIVPVPAL